MFPIFLLAYGYWYGRFQYVVHRETIVFEDLPKDFDGYRIVQLSDLHAGSFRGGNEMEVQKIVNIINAEQPDLIVFTGDIVNRCSDELDGFRCMLSDLSATDGVYSILGNHDYAMFQRSFTPSERKADVRKLVEMQTSYGWKPLLNDNNKIVRAKSHIFIAGVENQGYARMRFPKLARLDKALKGITDKDFTILLSHDPSHWSHDVKGKTNIQLTLSGHTHAGQFKIFGWSPVKYTYPEWSGVYIEGSQVLNVSEGIGGWLPFRYGAWPEINVITLKRK